MGSIINTVCTSKNAFIIFCRGYINSAVLACKSCIKKSDLNLDSIQLLINTGIYKEDHICEPAVSSMIHDKLQCKISGKFVDKSNDFFSFDMSNGGIGTLQALQVVDNYIASGTIINGMVVSGDTEPIPGNSTNYNYASGAASIILSQNPYINSGFRFFNTYHDISKKNAFKSYSRFTGNNIHLTVEEQESYLEDCLELTTKSIATFLTECSIDTSEINLIISSQSPKKFAERINKIPGLENKAILPDKGEKHTSGILFGLNKAINSKQFKNSRNILFVTVAAGISVSLALYTNSENY